jgi:hypothetical protein
MTELGLRIFFLEGEFLFLHKGIFTCQCAYVTNILAEFEMSGCNPMPMPFSENANLNKDE